jgi:transcriptional regulator with AAA-type ATPase domain
MPPLTAENLPELREYWGEDIMQMVEDFIKTSNGKVPHGTK